MSPSNIQNKSNAIEKRFNQIFQAIGVASDELFVKGCDSGECQVEVKVEGKREEKKFKDIDALMAFANRWLKEHPGAAKNRGGNSHPLFARLERFILVDQDSKHGADAFLFLDNDEEWKLPLEPVSSPPPSARPSAPSSGDSKPKNTIKPILKFEPARDLGIVSGFGNLVHFNRSFYREQGVVFGDEAHFFVPLFSVAKASLPGEEFLQLEEKLYYQGKREWTLFFDEAEKRLRSEYAYHLDRPLILATLEKLQAMDWKALDLPVEKLHPLRFMKSNYPFTVKKDPKLPDILTPLHEIHLAGHPEIKISWSDPYLRHCYEAFLKEAGINGDSGLFRFKDRDWLGLEKRAREREISVRLRKSTGEIEMEKTVSASYPKNKGYQLTMPEDSKAQPFVLSVHGRSLRIFAPYANAQTKELMENWGEFLSYFPESFIPPLADRLIKRNSVAIELARDNRSFTIKWDNPIANAIAGVYPVQLPENQDFESITNFVFTQGAKVFSDNSTKQKAIKKYFFEDLPNSEPMSFPNNFWEIFEKFIRTQYKADRSNDSSINYTISSPPENDQPLFHWLYLAKYFSDYSVDKIGNISKADLLSKSTIEEMGNGFVPSDWENGAQEESRASEEAARRGRVWQVPVGLGVQSHFRDPSTRFGPRLQAQLLGKRDGNAFGLEGEYSFFKEGEVHHRLGLAATFRLQKEIIPVEHHLMGGLAVWTGFSLGGQYSTASHSGITPLGGLQIGAQLYDKYSFVVDAQTNGKAGGSRLGLSLQMAAVNW